MRLCGYAEPTPFLSRSETKPRSVGHPRCGREDQGEQKQNELANGMQSSKKPNGPAGSAAPHYLPRVSPSERRLTQMRRFFCDLPPENQKQNRTTETDW